MLIKKVNASLMVHTEVDTNKNLFRWTIQGYRTNGQCVSDDLLFTQREICNLD